MKQADSLFLALVKRAKLPAPVPELRFAPPRRWRFDYAFVEQRVALEIEGGVFTRGRHTRAVGYIKDMEKYSEAAILGWCVIRVTPKDLCSLSTINLLTRAFARATGATSQSRSSDFLEIEPAAMDTRAVAKPAKPLTLGAGARPIRRARGSR